MRNRYGIAALVLVIVDMRLVKYIREGAGDSPMQVINWQIGIMALLVVLCFAILYIRNYSFHQK
jgi:hypothetical protein